MGLVGRNVGDRNGQWKGDDVGIDGLHAWVARRLKKPERCPRCGEAKRLELSCKSHEYSRDLSKWEYLCRGCHSAVDQKIRNIVEGEKPRCCVCGVELDSTRKYCSVCRIVSRRLWWKEFNAREERGAWRKKYSSEYYRLRKEKNSTPGPASGVADEKATAA